MVCSVTGKTPAGLRVYVPGRSFTVILGADGAFQMDNVPAGSYSLSVATAAGAAAGGPLSATVGTSGVSVGALSATCP